MHFTARRSRWLLAALLTLLAVMGGCLPARAPGWGLPSPTPTVPADTHRLTILLTNDEHGWIAAQSSTGGGKVGGAAELAERWRSVEGYAAEGPFLVLSGGDMWTGPAISSWFNGDSTAEVMDLMGYRAAAVGNHEFDFGVDVLRRHAEAARFPYLSANLVVKSTGQTPDFIRPYVVFEVGGVQVGLIGLTTTATPEITNPRHFAGFDVRPYAPTLERYVPEVQSGGADLIVVLTHVCGTEMRGLAPVARALGVDVLTAGHCHERIAEGAGGLPLIGGGQYMQGYARLVLEIDLTRDAIVAWQADFVDNRSTSPGAVKPAPAVAARVAHWQAQADAALGQVIGFTKSGVAHRSNALSNLVTDAWLWAYGTADAAVTNVGGFRQGIDAGPITFGDVVGVLPFNNHLVEVTITGAQLQENLDCCGGVVGGVRYRAGKMTRVSGEPLARDGTYRVLINDFMAGGGDRYKFGQQDPDPYFTAIDWRQPVIDYIRQFRTSESDPLETHLDAAARMEP